MTFKSTCEENGILYIANVRETLEKAKKVGIRIDGLPHNPHCNNAGHANIGQAILGCLIDKKLIH